MKIGDEEYIKTRVEFFKEEYNKLGSKPIGLCGHWSWYLEKEKELQAKLREENRIDEDDQAVS